VGLLTAPGAAFLGLPDWGSRLVLAAVVVAGAAVLLGVVRWLAGRARRRAQAGAVQQLRQRETAIALLATTVRYLVVIAAIVAVAIALAGGGGLGAIGGTALIAVILGFASQRFLIDVIAGFFILFENQYSVGDVVRLEPSGNTGVVEELGLRATVLRDLNGDLIHVPNGAITSVRTVPSGFRTYRLELATRDPDALEPVVTEVLQAAPVGRGRFLRPPRIAKREALGAGLTRLEVRAEVPPWLDELVSDWLSGAIRERAGALLAAPPTVTTPDPEGVRRFEAGLDLP
jgi:moderate conductance mechanosensitive channel